MIAPLYVLTYLIVGYPVCRIFHRHVAQGPWPWWGTVLGLALWPGIVTFVVVIGVFYAWDWIAGPFGLSHDYTDNPPL